MNKDLYNFFDEVMKMMPNINDSLKIIKQFNPSCSDDCTICDCCDIEKLTCTVNNKQINTERPLKEKVEEYKKIRKLQQILRN